MRRATLAALPILFSSALLLPLDDPPTQEEATVGQEREVDRIRTHLAGVLEGLRAAAPEALTSAQRAARAETIAWLDEYREAGAFPHNHVVPGRRVPVFVDPHGTPCAVGYLMLRSGARSLVDEIVRTDNLVRIPELGDDPRLTDWLASRGITLDEAALIQPAYDGPPFVAVQETSGEAETVGVSIATAALIGATALAGVDRGGPWLDLLLVGTTVGHGFLLTDDGPGWAKGLNGLGLMAGIATEVVRLTAGGDEGEVAGGIAPYVAPGRNGTEVGFLLRR